MENENETNTTAPAATTETAPAATTETAPAATTTKPTLANLDKRLDETESLLAIVLDRLTALEDKAPAPVVADIHYRGN